MCFRIRFARVLVVPAVIAALFTGPVYPRGSFASIILSMSGLLLLILSAGGRSWASVYITGKKADTLVTQGPYSIVRNPLYFFSLLGFLGAGLAFESIALAAFFGIVFVLTHFPTVRLEEQRLEELFGDQYLRYRSRVPRLLPRSTKAESGEVIPINARRLSGALRDCMAIPLIFIVAALLDWGKTAGYVPVFLHLP